MIKVHMNKATWQKDHRGCSFMARDSQRSTISRTFLCFYSIGVHRCMLRLCPRVKQ